MERTGIVLCVVVEVFVHRETSCNVDGHLVIPVPALYSVIFNAQVYVREVCPIAPIQIPRLDPVIQEAKRSVFMLLLISYESSVVEHSAALFDLLEARHSETTNNSCEPQQKPA